MDFPALPPAGDNLYRWSAFLGLLLAVISFVYPANEYRELSQEETSIKSQVHPLRLQLSKAKQAEKAALDELHRVGLPLLLNVDEQLKGKAPGPNDQVIADAVNKAADAHTKAATEATELRKNLEQQAVQLDARRAENAAKREQAARLGFVAVFGQVIGCAFALVGAFFWHRRTQRPQDTILQGQLGVPAQHHYSTETRRAVGKAGAVFVVTGLVLVALSWAIPSLVMYHADTLRYGNYKGGFALLNDVEVVFMKLGIMDGAFDRLGEVPHISPQEASTKRVALMNRLVEAHSELIPYRDRTVEFANRKTNQLQWQVWDDRLAPWRLWGAGVGVGLAIIGVVLLRRGKTSDTAPELQGGDGI